MDVTDFGTPVQTVSTFQSGDRVRMVVEPRGAWEHSAYQTDTQFVLEVRQQKIEEFRDRFANPYVAAERGYVDAVIRPRDTRKLLIGSLEMLETKRDKNPPKKHGNIPL